MGETVGTDVAITRDDTERLAQLRALLQFGRTFRQENREGLWRQSEAQYEGRHWGDSDDDPTADLITINISFSTVNTIIPYVTSEEPRFLVTPYSQNATITNARVQQAWLNRLWRKQSTGAHEALEAAAEDYLIYGDGYLKVSYTLTDEMDDSGEAQSHTSANIFVDRLDPWDLFVDPMADGLHNARWVCHRIYTTKEEVEQDARYDRVDIDDLVVDSIDSVEDRDQSDRSNMHGDTGQDWVVIYEFYDLIRDEMWSFGTGGDRPLRVVEDVKMQPIVQIGNYRIPRSPYHMGELEQLWPMQQELNKSRSQLITHRRRNVAKYLIRKDAMTDEGIAALLSPIVNEMVPVVGEGPLDNLVKPAQLAPLPPEAYDSADQALRDIYEISGVNEYLRGASPEIRRTATEATIIEGASNVKTRAKLADVERAVRRVGALIVETAKDVYPDTDIDEMSLFITGNEAEQLARDAAGAEADEFAAQGDQASAQRALLEAPVSNVVVSPTEDIFIGQYEIDVETGSTEMRSPSFKESKYREMVSTVVGMQEVLVQAGVNVNLRKLMELWFEAAQITDVAGLFHTEQEAKMAAPQPDPTQMPPGMEDPNGMGLGPAQQGAPGMPPELAAMLQAGPPGGDQPMEGVPNVQASQMPLAPVTPDNSGMMAPAAV